MLQLRDEGKISEAEYNDLLAAMRTSSPQSNEGTAPGMDKTKSKRRLGKIAFVLMLGGIVLPIVLNLLLASRPGEMNPTFHRFGLCLVFEIAAFVLGLISWSDVYGKITVVTIAAIAVLVLLYMVLYPLLVVPEQNL